MTTPSPIQKNKARRATAPAKPDQEKTARKPAYLQSKMSVSQPRDKEEQEADQVAREVSRAPREAEPGPQEDKRMISSKPVPSAQRLLRRMNHAVARAAKPEEEQKPAARAKKPEDDKQAATLRRSVETEDPEEKPGAPVQKKLRRKTDAEETTAARVMRKGSGAKSAGKEAVHTGLQRASAPNLDEQDAQKRLARPPTSDSEQDAEEDAVAEGGGPADADVAPSVEERLAHSRGQGSPLPPAVLADMEKQLGKDLSGVVVHSDADAAELCKELNAQAFTVGSDVYFAPGEFAPETDAGRELLAHELAHVVQQSGSGADVRRRIEPVPPSSGNSTKLQALETMVIPAVKSRHLPLYSFLAQPPDNKLRRIRSYDRQGVNQRSVWRNSVRVNRDAIREKLTTRGIAVPPSDEQRISFVVSGNTITGSLNQLQNARLLKIPNWDRQGNNVSFDVDHIVELQVSGQHGGGVGNSIQNMELLDHTANITSGSTIKAGIYSRLNDYLASCTPPMERDTFLATHDVVFERVTAEAGANSAAWWTKADIENAEHLLPATPAPESHAGTAKQFVLSSGPGGTEVGRFDHDATVNVISPTGAAARRLAGLVINTITLNNQTGSDSSGGPIGTIQSSWDLPEAWTPAQPNVILNLQADGDYRGFPASMPPLSLEFSHLSPVNLDEVSIERGKLHAEGQLTPSIELLNAPIAVTLDGRDITFSLDYGPESINLPLPGVTIDDATLSIFYSTERGLGLGGAILFSVANSGTGELNASVSTSGGVRFEGVFTFDRKLFDRARLRAWWRDGELGAEGEIGIDTPDKIKGVRSANLAVTVNGSNWAFVGGAALSIPGVEQASVSARKTDAGLVIGGELSLTSNAAIRSGHITVTCAKEDGEWKVSATGTAQPAIPGIESHLNVAYNDGAFTAEFSGGYHRGLLSGSVTVGATNCAVGADGRPSGDPLPNGALNVYGSGAATIQVAPWLQGTAGIRFDPSGEVTVSGEIGIPDEVQIFARKEINRSLFDLAVQVPLVPGVVAEVGGGLTAVAGIGPGVIDQMRIGITYNPAHEEDTHVTGDAHLRVPANAGLRLSARAGIGLGITGASATGGLEIGGTLGIEGAATAGVQIDWTPSTGLDLTAELALSAQPSFTFDIGGYVSVRALGINVYDKRWQLGSYAFGSDYRFGISLPVHYHEGQPFDVSLDDVKFEVPNISPGEIVTGLINRIA
jgi:Domain of unknown function (DUF4157)